VHSRGDALLATGLSRRKWWDNTAALSHAEFRASSLICFGMATSLPLAIPIPPVAPPPCTWTCTTCITAVSFGSKRAFEAHRRVKHPAPGQEVAVFSCPLGCGKKFPYKSSVHNHLATHKSIVIYCKLCDPSGSQKRGYFASQRAHRQHIRRYHDQRPVACTECWRRFLTQEQRDAHVTNWHDFGVWPR
jgi:hypothetical protein